MECYIRDLMRSASDPDLRDRDLRRFIAEQLAEGALTYFAPYETVHRQNVERAVEAG